ncbi:type VI secretion system protein TssA [Xanthobacter sp. TB0139]|uniref:type VI secretion system protein TssA n=1 Tax=Xanthobacter sp. TB0139 TaxID=3459178 RepID=UPI00403A3509
MQEIGAFDPEELLHPVSEDAPCGTDPRSDPNPNSLYYQAKDGRAAARRIERSNDVEGDTSIPYTEWEGVADACAQILADGGKDLEVATWLIEALVRLRGFAGLHSSLLVAAGLVTRYWDDVFPLPDEDSPEPRLTPFINLNGQDGVGTLIQPLRKCAVTSPETGLQFWQYEQAVEISQISDESRRSARLSSGGMDLEVFTQAVQQTPAEFYGALSSQIEASLAALNTLSDAFADKVGHDAPPAGAIRAILNATQDAIRVFAADKLEQFAASNAASSEEMAEGEATEAGDEAEGTTQAAQPGNSISKEAPFSREDALRQLLKIAAYFRENEPHSPISYTLEEIVRRGRMPLTQLLDELIIDEDARRYFYIASGLKPPSAEHEE